VTSLIRKIFQLPSQIHTVVSIRVNSAHVWTNISSKNGSIILPAPRVCACVKMWVCAGVCVRKIFLRAQNLADQGCHILKYFEFQIAVLEWKEIMGCSVLQCVAVCCSVLRCVEVRCVEVCCGVLQSDAVWCINIYIYMCNKIQVTPRGSFSKGSLFFHPRILWGSAEGW